MNNVEKETMSYPRGDDWTIHIPFLWFFLLLPTPKFLKMSMGSAFRNRQRGSCSLDTQVDFNGAGWMYRLAWRNPVFYRKFFASCVSCCHITRGFYNNIRHRTHRANARDYAIHVNISTCRIMYTRVLQTSHQRCLMTANCLTCDVRGPPYDVLYNYLYNIMY